MKMNPSFQGLANASATAAYVFLVSSFMTYAEGSEIPESIFGPMAFLLLFVLSAAITGFLVFGKPVMWYLDGQKKEAISLLTYTVLFLALIFGIVFSIAL